MRERTGKKHQQTQKTGVQQLVMKLCVLAGITYIYILTNEGYSYTFNVRFKIADSEEIHRCRKELESFKTHVLYIQQQL